MSGVGVARGPALRAKVSPRLFEALRDRYGLAASTGKNGDGSNGAVDGNGSAGAHDTTDLGGSSNLNLLLREGNRRWVVRVYRPWVTASRLGAIQQARRQLASGGVPCALPLR